MVSVIVIILKETHHGKESKHEHKPGKALMHAIHAHKYLISSLFSIHPLFKWYDSWTEHNRNITNNYRGEEIRVIPKIIQSH